MCRSKPLTLWQNFLAKMANSGNKVYVGNLGTTTSQVELETAFSCYGPIKQVWIAKNPPGFAFIEFLRPRDAEDAVRHLDGTRMCGVRIRAEMSTGRSRGRGGPPPRTVGHYKSRSRSPVRRRFSRSKSRSRSRSPLRRGLCRSNSRSRSRSTSRSRNRRSRNRRSRSDSRGRR